MLGGLTDAEILGGLPDFVSLPGMLKSSAHEEGGRRFLYLEASNEDPDHQGEIVLQKALVESSDYFLRHGNIDLSHYTIIGPKLGIPNHLSYEIGRPAEVRAKGSTTFVKAELFTGSSPMASNANLVWDSITKQSPPMRWYPSVGGAVLAKSVRLAPNGDKVGVIDRVRWNNIALDRTPVSKTVQEVSQAPIGSFAKAYGGFVMAKTLTAGYGTDSATLAGGGALREQSLMGAPGRDAIHYFDFRDRIAGAMRTGQVGEKPRAADLLTFATKNYGLSHSDAGEYVERFMRDLATGLKRKAS
jgi:hypothetical protein